MTKKGLGEQLFILWVFDGSCYQSALFMDPIVTNMRQVPQKAKVHQHFYPMSSIVVKRTYSYFTYYRRSIIQMNSIFLWVGFLALESLFGK